MGIIHKPTLSMYWSSDVMYATPLFSAIMPRNRFELLLKFFHLNDNTNEPDRQDPHRDRLFKLRPLVDHLFEHFQLAYTPGPSVAVDETLLLWKGRLHFRQYIPLKRARFGIKMFSLAEDSGYIYIQISHLCGERRSHDKCVGGNASRKSEFWQLRENRCLSRFAITELWLHAMDGQLVLKLQTLSLSSLPKNNSVQYHTRKQSTN